MFGCSERISGPIRRGDNSMCAVWAFALNTALLPVGLGLDSSFLNTPFQFWIAGCGEDTRRGARIAWERTPSCAFPLMTVYWYLAEGLRLPYCAPHAKKVFRFTVNPCSILVLPIGHLCAGCGSCCSEPNQPLHTRFFLFLKLSGKEVLGSQVKICK